MPRLLILQNSWSSTVDMRAQLLAQEGVVVVKTDNRGSARRGFAFETSLFGQLGTIELVDQVAVGAGRR